MKIFKNTVFFILYCCCLLLFATAVFAQDIHFSQYDASPLNLNPALTGFFDGDYRFVANHRNQWSSVTVPYKTYSLSFDMPFQASQMKRDFFGVGMIVNNDKAGDAELKKFQTALSLSYTRKIDRKSQHAISFGIQTSVTQRSINFNKLMFGEQWDGDAYNPNLSNGQHFGDNSFIYFDLSSGVNWSFSDAQKDFRANAGFALSHINEPTQTFLTGSDAVLYRKITVHGKSQIKIHPLVDLLPSFLFEKQSTFKEFLVGTSVRYILEPKYESTTAVYLGGFLRTKDAFILTTGMDYKNLHAGLSYDINFSTLRPASNNRGGFEIAIIYIIRKFVPLNIKRKSCPAFL